MASPELLASRVADAVKEGNLQLLNRWSKHPRFNPALAGEAWVSAATRSDAADWFERLSEAVGPFQSTSDKRKVVWQAAYHANTTALAWLFTHGARAGALSEWGASTASIPLLNPDLESLPEQGLGVLTTVWEHLEPQKLEDLIGYQASVVRDFFYRAPVSWVQTLLEWGWHPDSALGLGGSSVNSMVEGDAEKAPEILQKISQAQALVQAKHLDQQWAGSGASAPKPRL